MKRFVFAVAATVVGLVLLLGYKTGSPEKLPPAALAPATPGAGTQVRPTPNPTPSASAGSTPAERTVTGAVEQTPYGAVQVRVRLSGSRILDVTAVQLPADTGRSMEISRYAGPVLRQEVLSAQSAQIDTVSGATWTSEGYAASLQSAFDGGA
jgi:uncharacterized protein with FMN-binding domain